MINCINIFYGVIENPWEHLEEKVLFSFWKRSWRHDRRFMKSFEVERSGTKKDFIKHCTLSSMIFPFNGSHLLTTQIYFSWHYYKNLETFIIVWYNSDILWRNFQSCTKCKLFFIFYYIKKEDLKKSSSVLNLHNVLYKKQSINYHQQCYIQVCFRGLYVCSSLYDI